MLHFAYGANMSSAVMRKHAPGARPLGVAELAAHRFVIAASGYASVVPENSSSVLGVLWQLTPRDRVKLDIWENVSAGLYRTATLSVRGTAGCAPALVYIALDGGDGVAKRGYVELVTAAAREWNLPGSYIGLLERWLPARGHGKDAKKIGEFR
jgi:hypothetical protein